MQPEGESHKERKKERECPRRTRKNKTFLWNYSLRVSKLGGEASNKHKHNTLHTQPDDYALFKAAFKQQHSHL